MGEIEENIEKKCKKKVFSEIVVLENRFRKLEISRMDVLGGRWKIVDN